MRKIAVFLAVLCLIGFLCIRPLKAEEIGENEPEITNVEDTEEELTQDKVIALIKDKFQNSELGIQIINWLIDTGFLTALVGVVIKYNKYKNKTVEELAEISYNKAKDIIEKKLTENTKEIEELKELLNKVNKANEVITKVLVLSQDKSAEGKIALLDYITQNDSNQSKKAEEIKQEIIEEEKEKEEIVEQVNKPYEDINIF